MLVSGRVSKCLDIQGVFGTMDFQARPYRVWTSESATFAVPVAEDSLPFGICEFLRPSFWSQSSQLHWEFGSCKFQQECIHCGVSQKTWIHALELPSLQEVFAKATRTIHFWKPSLTWPCCPKSIPSKCKSPNLSHLGNASQMYQSVGRKIQFCKIQKKKQMKPCWLSWLLFPTNQLKIDCHRGQLRFFVFDRELPFIQPGGPTSRRPWCPGAGSMATQLQPW